jgi:hypothetical protein
MRRAFLLANASVGRADRAWPKDIVAVNPDFVGPPGGSITRGSVIDNG